MAQFYINPGELRTQIQIQAPVESGTGINKTTAWNDLCNPMSPIYPYIKSKWLGLKGAGTEVSDSTQVIGYSILVVRYNAAINEQCRIVKNGVNYQITNVDDPTQRCQWLQITVKTAVMGE
jgi:head-tail adaptor